MNKIAISLIALAAISTASFAGSNRSYDLRDSDTYFGKYSTQLKNKAAKESMTVVTPLAVEEKFGGWTNFDRMKKISEENDHGRH